MMNARSIIFLILILGLPGCIKLAGSGGGSSAAMKGIHYNKGYIGSLSVVDASRWEDWHSQARFFEHFGGSDSESKQEINENAFDGKINIIRAKDDYKIQIVFKTESKNSNEISALFKRGTQEGDIIEYNDNIFSKDVLIKRPDIKAASNFDLKVFKASKGWKIFVSNDGNEIEGYRLGTVSSTEDEKNVVRFRVYIDKYNIVPLPKQEDRVEKDDEEDEASETEGDQEEDGGEESP